MFRKIIAATAMTLVLSACGSSEFDRSDPDSVANEIVRSYKDRDTETFASLMPKEWGDEARDLRVNGKDSAAYKILYGADQPFIYLAEAPTKLPSPRYDDYEDCLLYKVAVTTHERFSVLCVSKTSDGTWAMEDMFYNDPEEYENLPKPTRDQL